MEAGGDDVRLVMGKRGDGIGGGANDGFVIVSSAPSSSSSSSRIKSGIGLGEPDGNASSFGDKRSDGWLLVSLVSSPLVESELTLCAGAGLCGAVNLPDGTRPGRGRVGGAALALAVGPARDGLTVLLADALAGGMTDVFRLAAVD